MHTNEMEAGIVHVGKTIIRYTAIAHKSGGNYKYPLYNTKYEDDWMLLTPSNTINTNLHWQLLKKWQLELFTWGKLTSGTRQSHTSQAGITNNHFISQIRRRLEALNAIQYIDSRS